MNIRITFHGAAGEVTGSKHLIETPAGSKILLDCGLFQGKREEADQKNREFGFQPHEIDAVLISHAHIDHTGLIPKLGKDGFNGPIYCTQGTKALSEYMLEDSARIQEEDERYFAAHLQDMPEGTKPREALYRTEDVIKVMKQFHGAEYRDRIKVTDDVEAEFYDAGHVFGSSIIVLWVKTPEGTKKIVFTGDLGRVDMPILQDPECVGAADYLLIESTYGDREHERVKELAADLEDIINRTMKRGGIVLIPVFALERTQEMILRLEELVHEGRIPNIPIYIDSPLARNLTKVFEQFPEYYDEEMKERAAKNPKVFSFENLRFTESVEESKELNDIHHPCIIMAGSGMMESGRIRHHLKHRIEDKKNSLLVVGYQAEETLGRHIVNGESTVRILGRRYEVNLEVKIFKSLSAHADRNALDDYVKCVQGVKKIIIVHGEQESREAFEARIKAMKTGAEIILPMKGESVEL